jgi:integrase
MATASSRRRRQRGTIDKLPSGALRVRVYAGIDAVTKRRHDLVEIISVGPEARKQAEAARARLLNQLYERRHPRTDATVGQLLQRHLRESVIEPSTRSTYEGYVERHVLPFIGSIKVAVLDADVFDSFYAELRRCRDHCDGKRNGVDHRTPRAHECDERCRPHTCTGLSSSTIRQIHFILSGALRRAVRWRWISENPIDQAAPPATPRSNPRPPTPAQAARIINEAWKDPDWGMLVWLTMVTGLRRGELCAIRWRNLDLANRVLHLDRSIAQRGRRLWEKNTKTHQDRRIVLDPETVALLDAHRERAAMRMKMLGLGFDDEAFVFTRAPDGSSPLRPDSVSQRYSGLARRLHISTSLHKLRHYTATELISAGVDVRTVAGRLGHSGGGTTTLRTYTAWKSEADQRAAGDLAARMPAHPNLPSVLPPKIEIEPKKPYERVAVAVRDDIYDGKYPIGLQLPPVKRLAREHGVAPSTAHQAVKLLREWGLVRVATGLPTIVLPRSGDAVDRAAEPTHQTSNANGVGPGEVRPLDLEVRRLGVPVVRLRTSADPSDTATLHRLLLGAIKRDGRQPAEIEDYELLVRDGDAPNRGILTIYVSAVL